MSRHPMIWKETLMKIEERKKIKESKKDESASTTYPFPKDVESRRIEKRIKKMVKKIKNSI